MKLEIIKDGIVKSSTEYLSCFPTLFQIDSMQSFGYKFRLDGKMVSAKKILEMVTGETQADFDIPDSALEDEETVTAIADANPPKTPTPEKGPVQTAKKTELDADMLYEAAQQKKTRAWKKKEQKQEAADDADVIRLF